MKNNYIIAIGASAGGNKPLMQIISNLPSSFFFPVIVIQHLHPSQDNSFLLNYKKEGSIEVEEISDKLKIQKGKVYFAPANYHVFVEKDYSFSLSIDKKINFSRPSIDVFFESIATTYQDRAVGIILSGANKDGTEGLKKIKKNGGLTIAQNPKEAEFSTMPASAIENCRVDHTFTTREISDFLASFEKRHIKL